MVRSLGFGLIGLEYWINVGWCVVGFGVWIVCVCLTVEICLLIVLFALLAGLMFRDFDFYGYCVFCLLYFAG